MLTVPLGGGYPFRIRSMPTAAWDPETLTGRSSAHVVTLDDPPCTLHRDVVEPFRALRAAAARDGIDLLPVSSFRDFDRQLLIWNAKCRGERELYDREGALLDPASLGEAQRVEAILWWSALPGASRHHWGTEIDVIDGNAAPADGRPKLLPEEYADGGRYAHLDHWLTRHLAEYGFYRPYTTDRGGVQPEPWHLSHAATAARALAALTVPILTEAVETAALDGFGHVVARLPEIYERYVANVDPPPASLLAATGTLSPGSRPS